jgi:hypothetical protein
MLKNFTAAKSATNRDLIVIYAVDGMKHSVACVVSLDTLGDLFGRSTISQKDALLVVNAELDKFAKVISAKFEQDPLAFTPNPEAPHVLRYDVTVNDLQLSGQTYSASVLDAPATVWGKDGKF